jgi:small subunit ribosomal protein S2
VDIAIPGNDDAMRSVRLLLERLADSVEEGSKAWGLVLAEREKADADRRREEDQRREQQRQRDAVTEDWQRRLREEAEKRRTGAAEEKKPVPAAPEGEEAPAGPTIDLGGTDTAEEE